MLTNPRDAFRGQSKKMVLCFGDLDSVKVTKHSTILCVRYSFLLCNSNFVFKTRRFYDIRLQKMS